MDITETIIKAIPNCSRITDADQSLYQEFLKCEAKQYPYHYSRSWIFIKQISQGKGIKYFDKKKQHLITIAPNWGGEVPNYIFLPLGVGAIESVPSLAKELARFLGQKIMAKKIYGDENKEYLLKHGFAEAAQRNSQNFKELDDDKYPEIICSADEIIKATFGFPGEVKMKSFRNHIRKIKRDIFLNKIKTEERDLTKTIEGDFKDLVERWSLDIAQRTAKKFDAGVDIDEVKQWMGEVYYPHFIDEYADKVDNENIIAYVTYFNEKPAAFTSAYPLNQNSLAVNASFCDTSYSGLIQYQFYSLAARAKFLGYKYLNLGSNDTESQHLYKSSMGKIDEVSPHILELKK